MLMLNAFKYITASFIIYFVLCLTANAQIKKPDTVKTGVYITSIHDINFKDKEYNINMWLWLKYKNKGFDFLHNLEVPQAKSVSTAFSTVDSSNNRIYMLMKLQATMKDSWATNNFPFDKQKLRFSIENSQFESKSLVFKADTIGQHFDPRFTLRGWNIDSIDITTGIKKYETAFGDESAAKPHTEYSNFKVVLTISRDAMGLFWKLFLGMYVAFLISFISFYIHSDSIDSRFGLGVGALFAVVGNKYIVDASLPETSSFTLVDMLHGLTLMSILVTIVCTSYSLLLVKRDEFKRAKRFDFVSSRIILGAYVLLNVWFIWQATRG
ncbi:hypothetical protein FPZ42_02345 [Mucilaginibacter achroorhodeus]|uniref:Uncharacterized protein n=2 Tax=Mucilaginibacter achroorhodeus TaxID=2599294 RepID=A0A563U9T5_9SPHI|nr:hypothetical protein FPZ42_02345 [Mucilaginibacter achroorhodeus]